MSCRALRKDAELGIKKRVQVIVEVEVEAGAYASEQYQSRITAPRACPNCGVAQSLGGARLLLALGNRGRLRRSYTNGGAAFFVGAAQ